MSRNWAAFALLLLVASVNGGLFVEDGQEYEYSSTITMVSGTMDHATHVAGSRYMMKVRLQIAGNSRNFEISNVRASQYVGARDTQRESPFEHTVFTDVPMPPITFSVNVDDDGKFTSISYPSTLNIFQRNLIRGWASQIQINSAEIKKGSKAFVSHEKTINGDCDISYVVTDDMVMKGVAHHKDCSMVHRVTQDWRGERCDSTHDDDDDHEHDDAHNHHNEHHHHHHHDKHGEDHSAENHHEHENPDGLFSRATTVFELEKSDGHNLIKSIQTSGSLIGQFFKTDGISYFTHFNHTAVLVGQKSSAGDISGGDSFADNLEFEFDDANYKWNLDRDLKAREPFLSSGDAFEDDQEVLATALKKGIAKQKEILLSGEKHDVQTVSETHRKGLQTLFPIMFSMNYDTLKSLADEFLADTSEEGMMRSNIFLELLGSTGSSASALLVRDLFLEKKFHNERDATRVLTSVPFHIRRPNTQLVMEYEKLLTSDSYHQYAQYAVPLTFGHLVRMTCERSIEHASECFRTFASKYVEMYWNKYKSSTDRDEKSLILLVLKNIRYGGISKALKPLIDGEMEGESSELRAQAIFTASYEALKGASHGVNYFFPVFADHHNSHEVRLAAITVIMSAHPSSTDFARITTLIKMEKNYEVTNYVFMLFRKYASSINPCDQETSKLAEYFLKYLEQFSSHQVNYNPGVSKVFHMQFHKKRYGYTGYTNFYTIGSHKSFSPIKVGFTIGKNLFESLDNQLLGVHLRIEGLAKGIIRRFQAMHPSDLKMDDLKAVFESMNVKVKPDQPIRVAVIITFKGTVIIHRTYDENVFGKEGKLAEILESMVQLTDSYSINHQRILQIGSLVYEQPSEVGIPMFYIGSRSALLHFTATVKRGILRGLIFRDVEYDVNLFAQNSHVMGFVNTCNGNRYGIGQDQIYHIHMPKKFVIGFNPSRKELKLNMERPPYDDPMYLMMHSVTIVAAVGKKLGAEADLLQTHCPSCHHYEVVSRGPESATDEVIVEKECHAGGFFVKAEYFDCELDDSEKLSFRKLLYAFSPYSKSPNNRYTALLTGVKQFFYGFYHFPRAEKCGLNFRFSQSEHYPVKEVEISIRAEVEDNGEKLFYNGKKYLVRMFVKGKGDPILRALKVTLSFDHTPGHIQNKFKLMINSAPMPGLSIPPYTACFSLENKYPDFPDEFLGLNLNQNLELDGRAVLQFGRGSECDEVENEIKATIKHSTTTEGKDSLKSKWFYKQCMEEKSSPAWAGRTDVALPFTGACYKTSVDAANARKYTWNIQLSKTSTRMSNCLNKIEALVKAGMIPYWDMDPDTWLSDNKHTSFVNIELKFHDRDQLVDMKVKTDNGVKEVTDYPLSLSSFFLKKNLRFSMYVKRLMRYRIINACVSTVSTIQTLDNYTYPYDLDGCWTMMSGHCSPNPTYAVFLKKVDHTHPLAAKIHLGDHIIEFDPLDDGMRITADGEAIMVHDHSLFKSKMEVYKIFRWGSMYSVYLPGKVWIAYDGNFAEVVPVPSMIGQHCGLCGTFDRNDFDDLTGKQGQPVSREAMAEEWKLQC